MFMFNWNLDACKSSVSYERRISKGYLVKISLGYLLVSGTVIVILIM